MRRFGLIGFPLSHSFSKNYFAEKFSKEGLKGYAYENYPIPSIADLPDLLRSEKELDGFNVTIPYKEKVIPYLTGSDEVVKKIGACNCVKKTGENSYYGYNTDVTGFHQSLKEYLQPHHTSALILGTGGASKAVEFVLQQSGISYLLVSRNAGDGHQISYNDITRELIDSHLLIINTTPLGMYPQTDVSPQIPYEYLTKKHYLFDLIYNPAKTLFLQKAEERGASIKNGLDMLVIQAEESWRIWNESES